MFTGGATFADLAGWIGGILVLLVFYGITLWSSLLLVECQETDGVKHPTYRAAVKHVLGRCELVATHCIERQTQSPPVQSPGHTSVGHTHSSVQCAPHLN